MKVCEVHRVWFIRLCRFEKGVGEAEQLLMEIMLKILMMKMMMVIELLVMAMIMFAKYQGS